MCDYEPISDEELWGAPADELPAADQGRNILDEQQQPGDSNAYDDFYEAA